MALTYFDIGILLMTHEGIQSESRIWYFKSWKY